MVFCYKDLLFLHEIFCIRRNVTNFIGGDFSGSRFCANKAIVKEHLQEDK